MVGAVVHGAGEVKLRCFRSKVVVSFKVMVNHVRYPEEVRLLFILDMNETYLRLD